jgi:Beta-lactamase superfamily domain
MASSQMTDDSDLKPAVSAWKLGPAYPLKAAVPFTELMAVLRQSLHAGLGDSQLAAAIRTSLQGDERLAALIDADAPMSGGPLARPGLMFEESSYSRLAVKIAGMPSKRGASWKIPADRLSSGSWRVPLGALEPACRPMPPRPCATYASPAGALMRREHASVELQSSDGTRIVFDPVFQSLDMGFAGIMPPPDPGVTAAFVTHSHGDHFDVATLDFLAADGTEIYLPKVPCNSLLAADMYEYLGLCDIPRQRCELGSLTDIGNVTVEALPFYGEQPSVRVGPADARLRNWGSCYRVDTPHFSVLLLADSGSDPSGHMLSVISESVMRRGPIDVVLGCLRDIYLPFEIDGLPTYYTVLPMSGIRADYDLMRRGKLPSATLGISGMAKACAEARAQVFLPYAHGLTGYGEPIRDNLFGPGQGRDERTACAALSDELGRIGCDTRVVSWDPGDAWMPPLNIS